MDQMQADRWPQHFVDEARSPMWQHGKQRIFHHNASAILLKKSSILKSKILLNWVILHKLWIIRKIFQASYERSQRVQIFSVNVEFRTSYHRDNFMIHKSWICFQYFFFEFFMIAFDLNYGMTVKWFKRKSLIELDYTLD